MCESTVCPWEPQKAEGRSDTSGPRPLPDHFRLIIMMNNNQLKLDFLFSVIFCQLCSFADLRIVVNMRLMVWVVLTTGTTNPRSRRRRLRLGRPRRLHGLGAVCPFCFTFTELEKKMSVGRHWISHGLCGCFLVTYQTRQSYCLDWPLFHKWVSHPLPMLASKWALMWALEKYKVVAFSDHFILRRSPSLLGSETEKLNQLNVWKIAMAICQDSKVYISRIYWVLLFWRREMAASFRQTALSAMTGDGWMLIWIILKVESDTFWLLWFSKILTEMPTKMGITFSFTFKLCHGEAPRGRTTFNPGSPHNLATTGQR